MITVIFEKLTKRQQAYREVCERHFIEIGDDSNSGGEDAAEYFTVLGEGGVECAASSPVARYCTITRGGEDFHYAYADYDTLAAAKERGVAHIDDSIYAEQPVEIVNLDTGKRYRPTIYAKWTVR